MKFWAFSGHKSCLLNCQNGLLPLFLFAILGVSKMPLLNISALLDGEQAWTSILNLKSFVMDSVQVGKAVFGKEIYTTLGIEQWTFLKMLGISLPEKKYQCLDFNVAHILNLAPA